MSQQRHRIAFPNQAFLYYCAVERHRAVELLDYPLENAAILLQRVGIIRRHNATPAELGAARRHGAANGLRQDGLWGRDKFGRRDIGVRPCGG
jgi:hypothetical protein